MKQLRNIVAGMLVLIGGMLPATTFAQEPVPGDTTATLQQEIIVGKDTINQEANQVDVKGIVFGHIGDSYEWHITNIGKTSICIPLPIIVYSETSGWHAFLSSRLEENGGKYEGFYIAPAGSKYEGKVVERNATGEEVNGRIPVVNFAAGGIATPADAALMMQLGAEGVFVGSGIFKSGDPRKRAEAIVKAVTNFEDYRMLAELSEDLGEAMVGINEQEIELLMAERGR